MHSNRHWPVKFPLIVTITTHNNNPTIHSMCTAHSSYLAIMIILSNATRSQAQTKYFVNGSRQRVGNTVTFSFFVLIRNQKKKTIPFWFRSTEIEYAKTKLNQQYPKPTLKEKQKYLDLKLHTIQNRSHMNIARIQQRSILHMFIYLFIFFRHLFFFCSFVPIHSCCWLVSLCSDLSLCMY